jgi:MFS family permease
MVSERTLENDIEALEAKDRHDASSSEQGHIIQKTDAPVVTTKPSNGRPPFSLGHELVFTSTLLCGQIVVQAGIGQGLAPLHIIGDHFSVTNNGELSWYIASFALITGTFILVAGRLGDMYGSKRILIIGFSIYGLWSLIAGAGYFLRSSDKLFVVARALQGIGASLLLPNAVAILGRTYPPGMRKNMVMSLFGAFAPGGYILGCLFSSIFAQFTIWAWAYFAMAIACAVLATIAHFVIPASPPKPNIDRTVDWLGFGFGISGLVLFNVAWNQGPIVGWPTPYVYVLFILGVLAFVAFVIVEIRAERPLVPVQQLNLHIALVLLAILAGWSSFTVWLYYLWQFLEELRGVTPLLATAQNTPSAISGFVASVTTGILIGKIGVPPIMILAMSAFLISNILVATMPVDQIYWAQTFVATVIVPWGMDMSFPAAVIMLSAAVPPEHQGIAASLALTTTNYAMSIGLGIAGTAVSSLSDGSDLLADCRHAWYVGIGLSGLGMVIAMISMLNERRHPTMKPH